MRFKKRAAAFAGFWSCVAALSRPEVRKSYLQKGLVSHKSIEDLGPINREIQRILDESGARSKGVFQKASQIRYPRERERERESLVQAPVPFTL